MSYLRLNYPFVTFSLSLLVTLSDSEGPRSQNVKVKYKKAKLQVKTQKGI
jgi:hypothetical protein